MLANIELLNGAGRDVSPAVARGKAAELYSACYRRGLWWRIGRWLRRRSSRLSLLDEERIKLGCHTLAYAGLRAVPIARIRGSESRAGSFDGAFHPLGRNSGSRQRWLDLAARFIRGVSFPPVKLIQVGDGYYVRDGHHRISVAKAFGNRAVDAEVTVTAG